LERYVVVSVLMAVYDPPEAMLAQAMDSIAVQTHGDIEFLIIDDGSPGDSTRAYLARRAEGDSRIRIAWEPHRGLTASLNRGLELARGGWIARQDADDWSEPGRLDRQIAYLRANPKVSLLGSDVWTHQQNGSPLWRVRLPRTHAGILRAFPRGNPFVHGAVMFRKAAAEAAGGYREVFGCSQDYDLFWRLAESGVAANLAEPLYHYRFTAGSVSAGRAAEQAQAHRAIRKLAAARARGEAEDAFRALAEARAEMIGNGTYRALLKQADHCMLAGEYGRAGSAYWQFLRAHRTSLLAWMKLLRLGLFRAVPRLREACFR
jgi:glycosyltransferase involved in cell wall biosynthesis